MGALDLLVHCLNFAAPALGVALLMRFFSLLSQKFAKRSQGPVAGGWVQLGVNFTVGLVVLAGGLWFFGRDGMMATYGALVVGVGLSQWVLNKGWRV